MNNPRQLRSRSCGCVKCLEEYPAETYGERKKRRDCLGSWQARFRDPTGTQKARHFKKKGEADGFLDSVRTQVRQRSYHDPKRGEVTLDWWWTEKWWPTQEKMGRPTTRTRKQGMWRRHIRPKWGSHPLNALDFMELQAWLSNDVKGHATQVKVLELLRAMLRDAVRDNRRIPFNPAAEVVVTAEPTAKHPDELKPPTEAQYALIRAELPSWYWPLADFLQETGMRWGEAVGLRRCHVNLEAGTAQVREVVIDDKGHLIRQAAPKTQAGLRTVPLTPKAVAAVEAMLVRLDPLPTQSAIEDGMRPDELIFRGPGVKRTVDGEKVELYGVLSRNNFRRVWIPAIRHAGVARMVVNPETNRKEYWPRVHDYRHALATRLHAAGVPEKDVQLVLGQKRGGKVTWLYTHGSEDALETVRSAMVGQRSHLRVVPDAESA